MFLFFLFVFLCPGSAISLSPIFVGRRRRLSVCCFASAQLALVAFLFSVRISFSFSCHQSFSPCSSSSLSSYSCVARDYLHHHRRRHSLCHPCKHLRSHFDHKIVSLSLSLLLTTTLVAHLPVSLCLQSSLSFLFLNTDPSPILPFSM